LPGEACTRLASKDKISCVLSLVKDAVLTAHATQEFHTLGGFFVSDEDIIVSDACDDVKGCGHELVEMKQYSIIPLEQRHLIFLWLDTLMGLNLLIFEVSRSLRHATFGITPPDRPAAQSST
jgi:hypothetical protein